MLCAVMCCHWTLTAHTRWRIVTLYSHAAPLDRHHKCGASRLCTPPFVAARTLTRRVSVHFRVTHHCVLSLPAVAFAIVSHRWPCGLILLARCPGCCVLSCAAIGHSRPARACVLSHCTRTRHPWTHNHHKGWARRRRASVFLGTSRDIPGGAAVPPGPRDFLWGLQSTDRRCTTHTARARTCIVTPYSHAEPLDRHRECWRRSLRASAIFGRCPRDTP